MSDEWQQKHPTSTSPADEDQRLVERAKRDPQAFAPLYARYFDPVYRYAHRRLGDRERAADATSQIFLKALAALPGYQAGSFRGWLFAIAHNVVVDTHRRTRPGARLPEGWDPPDGLPGPEHLALVQDEQQRLANFLARLTPEQRDVIELRLAGLTGQEIADQLGRSLAATRSIQFRAISRLRRWFAEEDDPATRHHTPITTTKETGHGR